MRSRTKAVSWSGVLLLFLWTCVSGQQSCAVEKMRPELQTPNETQSQLTLNSAFMTPIVHSFLGLVQPNPFPKGKFLGCSFDLCVWQRRTNRKCLYSCMWLIVRLETSLAYANSMMCSAQTNHIWCPVSVMAALNSLEKVILMVMSSVRLDLLCTWLWSSFRWYKCAQLIVRSKTTVQMTM